MARPLEALSSIAQIQECVVACTQCPRLVTYLQQVAEQKVRRFRQETYWAKPVPSFGDPQARLTRDAKASLDRLARRPVGP